MLGKLVLDGCAGILRLNITPKPKIARTQLN
jgi:hypothetical protein